MLHFGRANALVAKQLLNHANVVTISERMGSEKNSFDRRAIVSGNADTRRNQKNELESRRARISRPDSDMRDRAS